MWDHGTSRQRITDWNETKTILDEIHHEFVKDEGAIQYSHKVRQIFSGQHVRAHIPTGNGKALFFCEPRAPDPHVAPLFLTLKVPEKLQLYGHYVYYLVHICDFGMLRVNLFVSLSVTVPLLYTLSSYCNLLVIFFFLWSNNDSNKAYHLWPRSL